MEFKKLGDVTKVETPSGSRYHKTFEMIIDKKGHKTLHEKGVEDTYVKIQESLESTLIENILQRAAMGDTEALNRVKGAYLDTTEMPTSLADAQNKILAIKNEFYKLPIDIRARFDMSPEAYVHTYGTTEWADRMGFTKPEVKETTVETKMEVAANE